MSFASKLNLAHRTFKMGGVRAASFRQSASGARQILGKIGKMKTSLPDSAVQSALRILEGPSAAFARRYPGETGRRQPVHVVYGGAHLFRAGISRRLGDVALATLGEFAPDAFTFARAIGLPGAETLPKSGKQAAAAERQFAKSPEKLRRENRAAWMAQTIYSRVLEKLQREPVEDFRIDFEDGYGNRPDAEEDQHAKLAAEEVAKGLREDSLPPFIGIRLKPFSPELRDRSIRTLDLFVSALCEATRGRLPANFVVTLPKVVIPEQMAALAHLLEAMEPALGLEKGSLRFEMMIETTQAILNERGESSLPRFLDASGGPLHRRAFRHLRLHGELQHHRGLPSDGPSRLRLRQTHDAGRVCGDGHLAFRWRDQRSSRAAAPRGKGEEAHARAAGRKIAKPFIAPGGCTTATSSIRSLPRTTRAGTCIRRSFPRAMRPCFRFFWKGSIPRPCG